MRVRARHSAWTGASRPWALSRREFAARDRSRPRCASCSGVRGASAPPRSNAARRRAVERGSGASATSFPLDRGGLETASWLRTMPSAPGTSTYDLPLSLTPKVSALLPWRRTSSTGTPRSRRRSRARDRVRVQTKRSAHGLAEAEVALASRPRRSVQRRPGSSAELAILVRADEPFSVRCGCQVACVPPWGDGSRSWTQLSLARRAGCEILTPGCVKPRGLVKVGRPVSSRPRSELDRWDRANGRRILPLRTRPVMGPKIKRLCSSSTARSAPLGTRPVYAEKPPPQHPPKRPEATSLPVALSVISSLGDLASGRNEWYSSPAWP